MKGCKMKTTRGQALRKYGSKRINTHSEMSNQNYKGFMGDHQTYPGTISRQSLNGNAVRSPYEGAKI